MNKVGARDVGVFDHLKILDPTLNLLPWTMVLKVTRGVATPPPCRAKFMRESNIKKLFVSSGGFPGHELPEHCSPQVGLAQFQSQCNRALAAC